MLEMNILYLIIPTDRVRMPVLEKDKFSGFDTKLSLYILSFMYANIYTGITF